MNQTSGSLLRALRELKRVDEILQAGIVFGSHDSTALTRMNGWTLCVDVGVTCLSQAKPTWVLGWELTVHLMESESCCQGCSAFWSNMDGTVQKLAQMKDPSLLDSSSDYSVAQLWQLRNRISKIQRIPPGPSILTGFLDLHLHPGGRLRRDPWPSRSTLNAWWTSPTAANPWGSATWGFQGCDHNKSAVTKNPSAS